MKNKKWLLAGILGASLALTACGSGDTSANKESGNKASTEQSTANKGVQCESKRICW